MTTVHRGHARRYVHGHNASLRSLDSADYTVEDRGYETFCWIWRHGVKSPDGRGAVTIAGRKTTAYRAMYEQEVGLIPPKTVLDHLCEVPACIRPSHLQAVSQGEHMRRHSRARHHGPALTG